MKLDRQLPAILDLKAAAPLHAMLAAQRGADLQIGGAQVQRLGAQCLQVLLCAQTAWLADGKSLTITEPSVELLNSIELFGVGEKAIVVGQEQCA